MAQKSKLQVDLASLSTLRPLTISFASWLLEICPEILPYEERLSLQEAVRAASVDVKLVNPVTTTDVKKDSRSDQFATPSSIVELKVYTDYEYFKNLQGKLNFKFQLVNSKEEADFLFLTQNIRDFYSFSQRISQFPYEGGFVSKDLLIMTVRQRCYRPDAAGGYCAPQWWLPCFDLSTEFHLFAAEYRKRATATGANIADSSVLPDSGSETNCWIIKPARGTRGIGHLIVTSSDEAGLQQIAQSCPMLQLEYEEGRIVGINAFRQRPMDRIAQLLVTRPLLVKKRKFDLRLFVFIRSFVPFEAYMHELFYARLANLEYDPAQLSEEEQVALTVSAYSEDKVIADLQERLLRGQLRYALEEEGFAHWEELVASCRTLCRELFESAASSVGSWPRSSAYYSLDVILEEGVGTGTESGVTPRLLEVNFMGDWDGVKKACDPAVGAAKPTHALEAEITLCEWVNDLLTCLGTSENLDGNPRLVRL